MAAMDSGQSDGADFTAMRLARDNANLNLLCSNVVLLPGCVAKSGSSVVFFPAHTNGRVGSGELECKPEDICAILQYYHAVDKWRNADPKPLCVVADRRSMASTMCTCIAESIRLFSETSSSVVSDMIWIVKSDDGDETFVPPEMPTSIQLHVERARGRSLTALLAQEQQPLDIGGSFLFDPAKWLHYRMYMEAVLLNCEECLHKAEAQLTALNSLASDVNIHDVDINRRKVALLVSTLTLRLPGVVNSAEHLLQELEAKGSDELEAAMCSTTHYQASIDATKDVLRRLAEAKAELQSAGGLQECKDEELLVEGCDGPACPLAKIQQHGIPSYYSTMRLGESLSEARLLFDDFTTYMEQCKSYLDHRQCVEGDSPLCNMVVACFSAALQHRSDQLTTSVNFHVRSQALANWAILVLNFLASQFFKLAAGREAAQDGLEQLNKFLTNSPAPVGCGDELKEIYGWLSQPGLLLLSTQAVCRMVSVANNHLNMRREYLQRLADGDVPDGTSVLEDEMALVGVSDSEDEMEDEQSNSEPTVEQPKFEHETSGTPPRKIRAEESGSPAAQPEAEEADESTFGVWLRRVRYVMDSVAAISALVAPIAPAASVSRQLSSSVDEEPPLQHSWLINLQDVGSEFFTSNEFVDADAAAYQAVLKRRQELINELIEQEEKYIEDLERLIQNYVLPFSQDTERPTSLIGRKTTLFSNVEKILEFNQQVFLPSLKHIRKAPLKLGACFLEHERQFSTYSLYFKNMPAQEDILKHNAEYFKMIQTQRLQDPYPVEAYLLKPLSRIAKYRQCLQDLEKTAGDSDRMKSSRDEMQSAVNMVNFHLRHGNDLLALGQVKGFTGNTAEQGMLLRQDDFVVSDGWGNHKRRVFLFEDLIMFTKEQKPKKGDAYYQFKASYKISDFGLKETVADSPLKFDLTFRKSKPISFTAENAEKKRAWVAELHSILLRQFEILKERMREVQIGNEPMPAMSHPTFEQGGTLSRKRSPSFMSGTSSLGGRSASTAAGSGNRFSSTSGGSSGASRQLHSSLISGPIISPSLRSSVLGTSNPRTSVLSGSSAALGGSTTGSITPAGVPQPAIGSDTSAPSSTAAENTAATPSAMVVSISEEVSSSNQGDDVIGTSSFQQPPTSQAAAEESPDKAESQYDPSEEKNVRRETSL